MAIDSIPSLNKEKEIQKEKIGKNYEQFSILHQNIRSLGNAGELLEETLSKHDDVKILCLTEHWKTEKQLEYHVIKNFTLITSFCRDIKEHGGVAIYSENGMQVKERKDIKKISDKRKFECVGVEYNLNGSRYVCIAIYNDGNIDILIEALEPIIQKLFNENVKITLVGDFNINLMENSKRKLELVNLLKTYNMQQTIHQPTRITSTTATCIDNIFTNIEEPYESSTIQTHVSDHLAQKMSIFIEKKQPRKTFKRIFSEKNIKNFKQLLREQNWTDIYDIPYDDVNAQFNMFHSIYLQRFNKAFPLKKVSRNKKQTPDKIDPTIREVKSSLDILLVLSTCDEKYKETYREKKMEYDRLLLKQKKEKYDTLIKNSDNKSKTVWNLINSLKNRNTKKTESTGDPLKITNEMNNFFIRAGTNLTKNIQEAGKVNNFQEVDKSIRLKKITQSETQEIIKLLKNKHSSGYDEVSNHIIKQTSEEITAQVTYIINNSIKYGIFPDKLKIAIVKPIHKKGDINNYNNYRPISILPSFSKIIEMAYCRQIMEFLLMNKILRSNQHGYIKGKSIKTAIYDFINKVVESFENKELSMGIFLDLTKAYDCLDKNKLFQKLESYGIRGPSLEWVKSYFLNRKQMVEMEINEETVRSNLEELLLGVPQGSFTGPLFFLKYINDYEPDMELCTKRVNTVNYADDTNLLLVEKLFSMLEILAEITLNKTNEWFKNNNLILNKEKTKFILFTPTQTKIEEDLTINLSQEIYQIQETTKFLGIHIDKNLNWKEHINTLNEKIAQSIYGLRVISRYIYSNYLKMVYHGIVESKLRFGIIFYGAGNIKPLFILQKKAIRILNNMKYNESCRSIFKKNKLLTIYALYIQECVLFIRTNEHLFEKYENKKTFYDTRNDDYIYPKHNLTISQKQTEYRCLKIYNMLPKNIKTIKNMKCFKRKLFEYLIELEPYSLDDYIM